MKKRLIYLAALPIFALGLASCGEIDYMSKDFDIVIPEKDSKATNEYNFEEHEYNDPVHTELSNLYHQTIDNFYDNYSSVIQTKKQYFAYKDGGEEGFDEKLIIDFKNNSIYYYTNSYTMDNGNIDSYYKVESKSFLSDEKTYTTTTNISLDNYIMGTKRTRFKISGSIKIFTIFKTDSEVKNLFGLIDFTPDYNYNLGTMSYNDDFSYMYFYYQNENSEYGLKNRIEIAENGLFKYLFEEHWFDVSEASSNPSSETKKLKYEYFEQSILDSKYDTSDYLEFEYDESKYPAFSQFYDGRRYLTEILANEELSGKYFTITYLQ